MTEPNLFQEVDDDLQRQKYEALWKRYGNLLITCAFVIVVATAGFSAWHSWRTGKNQQASGGLTSIYSKEIADPVQEATALQEFAQKNPGTVQAVLARLHAASDQARQGNKDQAVQIYDAVAKDTNIDTAFRQFADLMSVETQLDTGDAVTLQTRLQPLAAADMPWHFTAKEYQGYLALRAGDKEKAKQIFTDLSQDASAPQTLSARASDILRYLGG